MMFPISLQHETTTLQQVDPKTHETSDDSDSVEEFGGVLGQEDRLIFCLSDGH